jgi:hypothetical protein
MEYKEVEKLLEIAFSKLGFKKGKRSYWTLQLKEITIVLGFKVQTMDKIFNIDLGIVFNTLTNKNWRNLSLKNSHIFQDLYHILLDLGKSHSYLDNLFSYNQALNSDTDIVDNISDVQELYKTTIIPYLEYLNNYAFLSKNFDKKIHWHPILLGYIPESDIYSKLFKE